MLLAIALPLASAAAVGGELIVSGAASFPLGAHAEGTPQAVFIEDALKITAFEGTAPTIRVHLFEDSFVNVDLVQPRTMLVVATNRPTWTAQEATLTIAASRPGWLGLHPDNGIFSTETKRPLSLEATARASIGNGDAIPDRDDPSRSYYLVEVDEPSIATSITSWSYEGAGAIKALGPRVTLTTSDNVTTFETGEMPDPDNPGRMVLRWIVIESDDLAIRAAAPAAVVSNQLRVDWDGAADLGAAHGTLDSALMTWDADGVPTTIEGALRAIIEPTASGEALRMDITGDMRTSTMSTRVPVPLIETPAGRAGFVILVGAVVAGAGTAALLRGRRRRTRSEAADLGADEYMQLAESAADGEHFDDALKWVRHAREHSPTSRRLALDEAFYTSMSGERNAALSLLHESILAEDPDACLLRARLLLESGEPEGAARALIQALDVAPVTLLDIETDPTYHEILLRDEVKRAIRQARRKLA